MVYWLLAREVMILRGQLGRFDEWEVMVDMFFYQEPEKEKAIEDLEKEKDEIEGAGDDESNVSEEAD